MSARIAYQILAFVFCVFYASSEMTMTSRNRTYQGRRTPPITRRLYFADDTSQDSQPRLAAFTCSASTGCERNAFDLPGIGDPLAALWSEPTTDCCALLAPRRAFHRQTGPDQSADISRQGLGSTPGAPSIQGTSATAIKQTAERVHASYHCTLWASGLLRLGPLTSAP